MGGFLPPAERRSGALLGLYTALSLFLLLTGERLPATALRGVGAFLFAPLDRVVLSADRMAAAWSENQELHQRITELTLENERLRIGGVENQELRRSLGLPVARRFAVQPVEILSLAGEVLPTAATISAGRRQGIETGDPVVTGEGLLGRIGETWDNLSRVILVTDPNSAVACEVESTGVLGVLRLALSPRARLVLANVPITDTLRAGQRVLTSGYSRHYPRGLAVGRVLRAVPDPSRLMLEVDVAPAVKLSRLRHAFVIRRGALSKEGL
ncbi:MAG TPA: rod shape-determining protein MreC [Candidatus Eisenbacteria bacterium]|jgi:rod shape-determining protein MreC